MTDHDIMSRADMVRNPMAAMLASSLPLSHDGNDAVKLVLRPYAELLEWPIPDFLRMLVDNSHKDARRAPNDL
jgi:hypothetical protein